jgi:hypothetical protein
MKADIVFDAYDKPGRGPDGSPMGMWVGRPFNRPHTIDRKTGLPIWPVVLASRSTRGFHASIEEVEHVNGRVTFFCTTRQCRNRPGRRYDTFDTFVEAQNSLTRWFGRNFKVED